MNRLQQCFSTLKQQNRKALIPYITAGDPKPEFTLQLMHNLVEAGADVIELGFPFSDPYADGPVITLAHERALANKITIFDVFEIVRTFRETNTQTPIVLMGYLNPIERLGYERFAELMQAAGVDGLLTVDMPPEEGEVFATILQQKQISPIWLLSPTSTEARVEKICQIASGFIYYISLKGVTGAGGLDIDDVRSKLATIQRHTDTPICVGFGISDANAAQQVASLADGVVVGSVLVKKIASLVDTPELVLTAVPEVLAGLRDGVNKAVEQL